MQVRTPLTCSNEDTARAGASNVHEKQGKKWQIKATSVTQPLRAPPRPRTRTLDVLPSPFGFPSLGSSESQHFHRSLVIPAPNPSTTAAQEIVGIPGMLGCCWETASRALFPRKSQTCWARLLHRFPPCLILDYLKPKALHGSRRRE